MFFFFTIPWIFVIALVVIALGIGVSVLQFILDHIIIISIIIWLPVALLVISGWRDKTRSDEDKTAGTIFPLFLVPIYVGTIRLIVIVLDALANDLWRFFCYLLTVPLMFGVLLAVCAGIALALMWLHEKVIKSKAVTIVFGILIASSMTYYLWNLS